MLWLWHKLISLFAFTNKHSVSSTKEQETHFSYFPNSLDNLLHLAALTSSSPGFMRSIINYQKSSIASPGQSPHGWWPACGGSSPSSWSPPIRQTWQVGWSLIMIMNVDLLQLSWQRQRCHRRWTQPKILQSRRRSSTAPTAVDPLAPSSE